MIDLEQLKAIAADEPLLILEVLEGFAEESEVALSKCERVGTEEAGRIYHQIRGSSGTLGLQEFSLVAQKHEERCRYGEMPPVMPLRVLLENSLAEARSLLRLWAGEEV